MMETIKTWTKGKLTYTIKSDYDECPDLSYLGEYTDTLEEGVIVRAYDEFYEKLEEDQDLPGKGREMRGFKPYAGGEKVGTDEYYQYGMQDYTRMEKINSGDIGILCLVCEISIKTKTNHAIENVVGRSSICGIGSDNNFEDFIADLVSEAEADYEATKQAINE